MFPCWRVFIYNSCKEGWVSTEYNKLGTSQNQRYGLRIADLVQTTFCRSQPAVSHPEGSTISAQSTRYRASVGRTFHFLEGGVVAYVSANRCESLIRKLKLWLPCLQTDSLPVEATRRYTWGLMESAYLRVFPAIPIYFCMMQRASWIIIGDV